MLLFRAALVDTYQDASCVELMRQLAARMFKIKHLDGHEPNSALLHCV
jgi:hypothetical protein